MTSDNRQNREKPVAGVYAALRTPRLKDGSVDEPGFRRGIEYLLERGVEGVVLNGATGECCLTTEAELRRLAAICAESVAGRCGFLVSIGAAGYRTSIALGRIAAAAGAKALLLPMPHFFPYSQEDLTAYASEVAAAVERPLLLYNLPRFTTPLEPETVCRLVSGCANIVGIKDSSGELTILRALTEHPEWNPCRIVGDDKALVAAVAASVADGVVSGVASVLPELIGFLWREPGADQYARGAAALDEFLGQLGQFPVPWGVKLVGEYLGIAAAHFSQPVSGERARQMRAFARWFEDWWPRQAAWLGQTAGACVSPS